MSSLVPVSISSLLRDGSFAVGSFPFLFLSSLGASFKGIEFSFDLRLLYISNLNGFVNLIDDRVHDGERISRLPHSDDATVCEAYQ